MIKKEVVFEFVRVLNKKVEPPFEELGDILGFVDEEMLKSDARPVVAPDDPETLMVHAIDSPFLSGFGGLQIKLERAVGTPSTM